MNVMLNLITSIISFWDICFEPKRKTHKGDIHFMQNSKMEHNGAHPTPKLFRPLTFSHIVLSGKSVQFLSPYFYSDFL